MSDFHHVRRFLCISYHTQNLTFHFEFKKSIKSNPRNSTEVKSFLFVFYAVHSMPIEGYGWTFPPPCLCVSKQGGKSPNSADTLEFLMLKLFFWFGQSIFTASNKFLPISIARSSNVEELENDGNPLIVRNFFFFTDFLFLRFFSFGSFDSPAMLDCWDSLFRKVCRTDLRNANFAGWSYRNHTFFTSEFVFFFDLFGGKKSWRN